jgi:D-alanyl-D-alanine carboxypeptidase/D-alanyl-D-alanine-endopeptidase (penicillin-binding protein 4)
MPPRHRTAARWLSGLVVAAVAVVAGPTTGASADTLPLSASDQAVHDRLGLRALDKRLGRDLAGLVTDAETGQVLWQRTPNERQLPASNAKLATAVNALETFGPEHRFATQVMRDAATPRRVYLVGSGDPSLSRRDLRLLATRTARRLQAEGVTRAHVRVDDSLFPAPTLATGWKSSYVITDVSPVRALVVDQHRRWDTSLDAGEVFAGLLRERGLLVGKVRRLPRPATATLLAEKLGATVATQVTTMLRVSDNDYAEALHRLVAVHTGFPPTWEGARDAARAALLRIGVDLGSSVLHDGSGLSRADRLAPAVAVAVLARVFDGQHPNLVSLQHDSLPVAGVSGTLGPSYKRYVTRPTRCAAGLVEAKTGSLRGVITLSGFARGADGRVKLFSFLLNRVPSTLQTRRAVDRLATTVTGCW